MYFKVSMISHTFYEERVGRGIDDSRGVVVDHNDQRVVYHSKKSIFPGPKYCNYS